MKTAVVERARLEVCLVCGGVLWVRQNAIPMHRRCYLAQWAFGVDTLVDNAYRIDLPPIERPGVNPDRHARIRLKHFARAADFHHSAFVIAMDLYRFLELLEGVSEATVQHAYVDARRLFERYCAAEGSVERCHWGCP